MSKEKMSDRANDPLLSSLMKLVDCINIQLESKYRHCGFCLASIDPKDLKTCSKCRRRAYCGVECQTKDWKGKTGTKYAGTPGQGHKDWCALLCGEDGVDWVIKGASGKGRGIFAKKKIPSGFRIIVEGFAATNIFDTKSALSTLNRTRLLNHSCFSNADRYADPDFKVIVIVAKKDIEEGQEITVNYMDIIDFHPVPNPFPEFYHKKFITTLEDGRIILERKFGIVCPSDCFCRNEENAKLLKELQDLNKLLDADCKRSNVSLRHAENGINIIEKMLLKLVDFNSGPLPRAFILEKGFQIGILQKSTMSKALEYIEECYTIFSTTFHPESSKPKAVKMLMN